MPYAPRPPIASSDRRGFSPPEAAERIGISVAKMFELIAAGEIESFKIGSRRIIPVSAIDDFIARKLAEARAEAG